MGKKVILSQARSTLRLSDGQVRVKFLRGADFPTCECFQIITNYTFQKNNWCGRGTKIVFESGRSNLFWLNQVWHLFRITRNFHSAWYRIIPKLKMPHKETCGRRKCCGCFPAASPRVFRRPSLVASIEGLFRTLPIYIKFLWRKAA